MSGVISKVAIVVVAGSDGANLSQPVRGRGGRRICGLERPPLAATGHSLGDVPIWIVAEVFCIGL